MTVLSVWERPLTESIRAYSWLVGSAVSARCSSSTACTRTKPMLASIVRWKSNSTVFGYPTSNGVTQEKDLQCQQNCCSHPTGPSVQAINWLHHIEWRHRRMKIRSTTVPVSLEIRSWSTTSLQGLASPQTAIFCTGMLEACPKNPLPVSRKAGWQRQLNRLECLEFLIIFCLLTKLAQDLL